jgi:hypothetical protein
MTKHALCLQILYRIMKLRQKLCALTMPNVTCYNQYLTERKKERKSERKKEKGTHQVTLCSSSGCAKKLHRFIYSSSTASFSRISLNENG